MTVQAEFVDLGDLVGTASFYFHPAEPSTFYDPGNGAYVELESVTMTRVDQFDDDNPLPLEVRRPEDLTADEAKRLEEYLLALAEQQVQDARDEARIQAYEDRRAGMRW